VTRASPYSQTRSTDIKGGGSGPLKIILQVYINGEVRSGRPRTSTSREPGHRRGPFARILPRARSRCRTGRGGRPRPPSRFLATSVEYRVLRDRLPPASRKACQTWPAHFPDEMARTDVASQRLRRYLRHGPFAYRQLRSCAGYRGAEELERHGPC